MDFASLETPLMSDTVLDRTGGSATLMASQPREVAARLADLLSVSIDGCRVVEEPFFHLEFDRVFPADVYEAMRVGMPEASEYRPMSGRVKSRDATPTRIKLDLFPEYIKHLPRAKRPVWDVVGRALRSATVKQAFVRRLAPGLSRRFGTDYAAVGMYPIPILTRDIAGYSISPHTDTLWKGITVQLYLPADDSAPHVGTVFHAKLPGGSLRRERQMRFGRNTGYAFAVGDDTWHSADEVGRDVRSRDSILLTYFVDQGALKFLRNRGRRIGNFVRNEARHLALRS
jgi:hypothetical protein